MYQAASLVQGKRALSSRANNQTSPKAHQILVYCFFGVTAGVLAGLLGVGGGVVMGPLFLELGIHPQVKKEREKKNFVHRRNKNFVYRMLQPFFFCENSSTI
uniref:Sulfite exporter TauE/SafE family protein n=1 Tax=Aegilops tauschii subsp. strangulata TaxID=200361 RepID=A0A452XFP3_AEGTS